MAETESIGSAQVDIKGDYSQLMTDLDQAQSIAANSAQDIAQSFTSAASSGQTLEEQVQALIDGGRTLREALDQINQATQETATVASNAAREVVPLDQALSNFVQSAGDKGQVDALNAALQDLADSSGKILPPMKDAADATKQVAEAATEAESPVKGLLEAFAAVTGITLGAEALIGFAKAGLEVFDDIQKASVAITALTGNAQTAREEIETFIGIAQNDALSLPGVVEAGQRMIAAGLSVRDTNTALQLAADTAAATGRSFDTVSNSLYRVVESGNASTRILVQLGVNSQDLANVMGTSAADVSKAFKDMDPSQRLDVMEQALAKFGGTATQMADTVGGQWRILKTSTELAFAGVAEAVSPAAKTVLEFLNNSVMPAVAGTVENFKHASDAVQSFDQSMGVIIHDAIQFTGLGKSAQEASQGIDKAAMSADDLSQALTRADVPQGTLNTLWHAAGPSLKDFADGLNVVVAGMQAITDHLPQLPGQIGTLTDALNKGAVAATAYGAGLKAKVDAEMSGASGTQAIVDAQEKADLALAKAKFTLQDLTTAYKEHKTTADGLTVTQDMLTRAQNAVTDAYNKAHPVIKDTNDAINIQVISLGNINQAYKDAEALWGGASDMLQKLVQQYEDGDISLGHLVEGYKTLKPILESHVTGVKTAAEAEADAVIKTAQDTDNVRNLANAYLAAANNYGSFSTQATLALAALDKANKTVSLSWDDLTTKPDAYATEVIKSGQKVSAPMQSLHDAVVSVARAMDQEGSSAANAGAQASDGLNRTLTAAQAAAQGVKVFGDDGSKAFTDASRAGQDFTEQLLNQALPAIDKDGQAIKEVTSQLTVNGVTVQATGQKHVDAATTAGAAWEVTVGHIKNVTAAVDMTREHVFDLGPVSESVASQMDDAFNGVIGVVQDLNQQLTQTMDAMNGVLIVAGTMLQGMTGQKLGSFGGFSGTPQQMQQEYYDLVGTSPFVNGVYSQLQAAFQNAEGNELFAAINQYYALNPGKDYFGKTPSMPTSSGSSRTPSAVAATSTTTAGSSLIDWLNSFTTALASANSATSSAGQTTLPDWVQQLSDALQGLSSTTTSPTGPTLPDWVQQLMQVIQQATSGTNIVDLTSLGTAIQSVLNNAMPAASAVAQFGQSLGTAGVMMTDVSQALTAASQTISSASTSLYNIANYKPPSFMQTPTLPTVPTGAFNPAGASGPSYMQLPAAGGVSSGWGSITIGNVTVNDPQVAQQMVTLLQRTGVRM